MAVTHRRPASVLHTGDFKMDQLPLDGRLTDLAGFARLGAAGVDLLLSDSTNAEIPGFVTPGARDRPGARLDLRQGDRAASSWPRFASHVHRVQQVLDSAHAHDRKVAFIGRSMVRNMGIARDLGLLRIPRRPGGRAGRGDRPAGRSEIVLMSTGSQGEPMSALGRMADRRPPARHGRGRRHRRAGQLAGAGQRDRGLPGHQPAVPGRRLRGAQGRGQGARLRATRRPASCCTCSTW